MYDIDIETHKRLQRGESPSVYTMILTHMGWRAYGAKELTKVFDVVGLLADGSILADGSETAGSETLGIIAKSARLMDISGLSRSLQPEGTNLLTGWFRKDLQHVQAEYSNADGYFNEIIAQEPFLGREFRIYAGFEDLPSSAHLRLFTGTIVSVTPGDETFVIEADEKANVLFNTFYLSRSGRYANPKSSNDRLPIVYGDLTDGDSGNWVCPCIDTVNFVHCYASSPVLSVAEGNAISVYADGVLVNPANYAFSASMNYESKGNIATITFTSDQGNAVISVRGKGKADTGVLMANVIDQVEDVLTVENSFAASIFESTLQARARQKFEAKGYKAAGVIDSDINLWELITKMMSSFLGSAYLDGAGELCLEVDDGTVNGTVMAGIITRGDAEYAPEPMLLENIINQLPANYAFNYVEGDFKRHTDDTTHANMVSQSKYGALKPAESYPFYWCRDLTSVQTVQDIVVGKFGDQLYILKVTDRTLKRIRIDVGDVVVLSAKTLRDKYGNILYNHFWKVLSVIPDYFNNSIEFRLLNTAYFMTVAELADGSHYADGSSLAGGERDLTAIY